ncbi:PREDICTED: uncharacterized protein LOC107333657 isoform X2 [Acropora digitifera]|uniref:uncharacterized protein LOC107333657 isoform X2 n=1 Tax=Acropora digitifera TaxID=70779 RepID=UPI00077ACEAE|nr:PREDICTED: uncharacterized protein LOC107333657 isoform X2 [Acropora digitifera]
MAAGTDKLAAEVMLDERFFFVVVIAKSKSIRELGTEIQNVARELFAEFRGEVSILETKNGARIPHQYTAGDVLHSKSPIFAYSSGYTVLNGKRQTGFHHGEFFNTTRRMINAVSVPSGHDSVVNTNCRSIHRLSNRPVHSQIECNREHCPKTSTSLHENNGECEEESPFSQKNNEKVETNNDTVTERNQIRRRLCFNEGSRMQQRSKKSEKTRSITDQSCDAVTDKANSVESNNSRALHCTETQPCASKFREFPATSERRKRIKSKVGNSAKGRDVSSDVASDSDSDQTECASTVYSPRRYEKQSKRKSDMNQKERAGNRKCEKTRKNRALKSRDKGCTEHNDTEQITSKQTCEGIQLSCRRLSTTSSVVSLTTPCQVRIKRLCVSNQHGKWKAILHSDDSKSSSESESDLNLAERLRRLGSHALKRTEGSCNMKSVCQDHSLVTNISLEERFRRTSRRSLNEQSLLTGETASKINEVQNFAARVGRERFDALHLEARITKDQSSLKEEQVVETEGSAPHCDLEEHSGEAAAAVGDIDGRAVESPSLSDINHSNSGCSVTSEKWESNSSEGKTSTNRRSRISQVLQNRKESEEKQYVLKETIRVVKDVNVVKALQDDNDCPVRPSSKNEPQAVRPNENVLISKKGLLPSQTSLTFLGSSHRRHSSTSLSEEPEMDLTHTRLPKETTTEKTAWNTRIPPPDGQRERTLFKTGTSSSTEDESSEKETDDDSPNLDVGKKQNLESNKDKLNDETANYIAEAPEKQIMSVDVTTDRLYNNEGKDADLPGAAKSRQTNPAEKVSDLPIEPTERESMSVAPEIISKLKNDNRRSQIDSVCSDSKGANEKGGENRNNLTSERSARESLISGSSEGEDDQDCREKDLENTSSTGDNESGNRFPDSMGSILDPVESIKGERRKRKHSSSSSTASDKLAASAGQDDDLSSLKPKRKRLDKMKQKREGQSKYLSQSESDNAEGREESVDFEACKQTTDDTVLSAKNSLRQERSHSESENEEESQPTNERSIEKESVDIEDGKQKTDILSSANGSLANEENLSSDDETCLLAKDILKPKRSLVDDIKLAEETPLKSQSFRKFDDEEESIVDSDDAISTETDDRGK